MTEHTNCKACPIHGGTVDSMQSMLLDSLVEVLDELAQGGDDDAVKARGFLTTIQSKKFVFLLVMFNELLMSSLNFNG